MTKPKNLAGTYREVLVSEITPNPWNPQHMESEMMERTKRCIRDNQFISPIVVRSIKPTKTAKAPYEIIDGEHRWLAMRDLGHTIISVIDLGVLQDHVAKALTLKLNDLHGAADPEKKADLIKDLLSSYSPVELMETLPYDQDYYTQFPEFSEWASKDGLPPGEAVDIEELAEEMESSGKSTFDGMSLVHMMIPNADVKEFQKLAKQALKHHGISDAFEAGLGKLVFDYLKGLALS